jgi:hypothetical protein
MFSLKSLLFAVAIAGLGTAGLIHRTQHWASALIAITLGILLLGVCRAWSGSKSTTFWVRFALVGGVYLAIVSLQPLVDLHYNLDDAACGVWSGEATDTAGRNIIQLRGPAINNHPRDECIRSAVGFFVCGASDSGHFRQPGGIIRYGHD